MLLSKIIEEYDLVVSRGGATTLYELIRGRVNVISIPSPYVKHNHQEKNVDYLYSKNLINRIYEKEFSAYRQRCGLRNMR